MTYHLTSPHMQDGKKGVRGIANLQHLLAHSRLGSFAPGPADGEYGPRTATAVRRAKYWLGYPPKQVDESCGPRLVSYLSLAKGLPLTYRIRRRARLKQRPTKPLKVRALEIAISQIGVKENPPGSNCGIPYNPSYWGRCGMPWCAAFVTWCFARAGDKTVFVEGQRWAYVPFFAADAKARRYGLSWTDDPEYGDEVCFDWPGESPGLPDHIGFFERWNDRKAGTFSSVEGNTAVGNDSNGGEVMRRERSIGDVYCFVRYPE